MAGYVTDWARDQIGYGQLNLTTAAIYWMLLTTAAATKQTTTVSTISSYELSGSGYVGGYSGAGRLALAGRAHSYTANRAYISATNPAWTLGNGLTVNQIVTWLKIASSDAVSYVISYETFPSTVTGNGALWTYQINANGLWTLV